MNDVLYVKDIIMEGDAAPFLFSETGEKKELNYFFFEKNADSSLRKKRRTSYHTLYKARRE